MSSVSPIVPLPSAAEKLAEVAIAFQSRVTGHAPRAVSVVLSNETLVITLHGALSAAERAMAQEPDGSIRIQEYHQQLFSNTSEEMRREIKRITGLDVRESAALVDVGSGAVVQAFSAGEVVQVFLLSGSVADGSWTNKPEADAAGKKA